MTYGGGCFNTIQCLKNHIKYLYFAVEYKSLLFGSTPLLKVHLWAFYAAIFFALTTLTGKLLRFLEEAKSLSVIP